MKLHLLGLSALLGAALAVGSAAPNYDEAKVPAYTLPDSLVNNDGSKVGSAAAWPRRRAELLEIFSREVYGRTPGGRPAGMHWEQTSREENALAGRAIRQEVTIWFTSGKAGPKMQLLLYLPKTAGRKQVPVILGLNYYGNQSVSADPGIAISDAWQRSNSEFGVVAHRATEQTRGVQAHRWSIETLIARGYAVATVCYNDLCEDRPEGLDSGVAALFRARPMEAREPEAWGAIGIWAWGLSRMLDYLLTEPAIDPRRVAVFGHSRHGKAALWAAAQDERFSLAYANESGAGGAALSKRLYGETVADLNREFPHWFAMNFRKYNGHEQDLPIDQHELLALVAPRALYVADADDDQWSDPRGEFLSLKAAEPVYALFGLPGLPARDFPPVNQPVHGEAIGFHFRPGKHDLTPYDMVTFLEFADRIFGPAEKNPLRR